MKINQMPFWAAGFIFSLLLTTSCKNEAEPKMPASLANNGVSGSSRIVRQGNFRGVPIVYEEIDGQAVLEGDIVVSSSDLAPLNPESGNTRTEGAGTTVRDHRWKNWTIPYVIGPNLDNQAIKNAIKHWEEKTPLRFVQRTNQNDFVIFGKSDKGNSSSLGRQGGIQGIALKEISDEAIIIHEIGHAVGLHHEHSRRDRDDYVNILWDNIEPDKRFNFNRWPIGQGFDYGTFDYKSVMMYDNKTFSSNNQPTIVRKDGKVYTPGDVLSLKDIRTVVSMYSCLYIVQDGWLNAVNPSNGARASLGDGWKGAAKTLADNDDHIWGIQSGKLWKVFRFNGGYEQVGNDDWTDAVGLTGQDSQGNFYAVYQEKLYKIDKYGHRSILGTRKWPSVKFLYYHNNALYLVWGVLMSKVNLANGQIERSYGGGGLQWSQTQGMAAVSGSSKNIYVAAKDAVFRVNTITGEITGGEKFASIKALTGYAGYLFIVAGDNLIKMDEFANKQILSGDWAATEAIGSVGNPDLVD